MEPPNEDAERATLDCYFPKVREWMAQPRPARATAAIHPPACVSEQAGRHPRAAAQRFRRHGAPNLPKTTDGPHTMTIV